MLHLRERDVKLNSREYLIKLELLSLVIYLKPEMITC